MIKIGNSFSRIINLIVTIHFLFYSFYVTVPLSFAQEIPTGAQLNAQIQQEINTQVNTSIAQINADTSSAPSPDMRPQISVNVANSGNNTTVDTSTNSTSGTTINNNSNADVSQNVSAVANTGNNQANGNICIGAGCAAGMIITGDAKVQVTGVVKVNDSATSITYGPGGTATGSSVVNSGNGLTITTTGNSTMLTVVNNGQTAMINQAANVYANTGGNQADGNIAIGGVAGTIITGDASARVNYLVAANGAVTIIGGDSNGNGPGSGASIILTNSGDYSRFNTKTTETRFIIVNNANRALISQACGYPIPQNQILLGASECRAITGFNTANGNIAKNGNAGLIQTGNAEVNVVMTVEANNTSNSIGSSGEGNSASTNAVNSGNNVAVSTTSDSQTTVGVNNYSDAIVHQNVNAVADTGHNTANGNICLGDQCQAGVIRTGNAAVNVLLVADVNNTANDINLGSGTGDSQANALNVINSGDNATFTSDTNFDNRVAVNNYSLAKILQNVVVAAITGFNQAVDNIGTIAGGIFTGNASVVVGQEASVNNTCTVVSVGQTVHNPCPTEPTTTPPAGPDKPPGSGGQPESNQNPSSPSAKNQSNGSSSSSNSSQARSDDGAVLGDVASILPATGAEAALWVAVAALLTFLFGTYLRRYKSGVSSDLYL